MTQIKYKNVFYNYFLNFVLDYMQNKQILRKTIKVKLF